MNEELKDVTTDGGSDNTEQNENLSAETLLVQKTKMREQRDEARQRIADLEAKLAEKESEAVKTKQTESQEGSILKQELELVKFAIAHKELDSSDIAELSDIARAKGVSLEKAMETPIGQAYLKDKASKAEEGAGIPDSTRSPKATPEKDVSQMTETEHRALWEKTVAGL